MAIQTSLTSEENSYDSDLCFRWHALGEVYGLDGLEGLYGVRPTRAKVDDIPGIHLIDLIFLPFLAARAA
jgi:hypothetical protein